MERRTIIAFVLIGILTFLWMLRMQSGQHQRQAEAPPPTAAPLAPRPAVPPAATPGEGAPQAGPVAGSPEPALRGEIVLSGEDLTQRSVWTNEGAGLVRARLTQYPEKKGSAPGVLLLEASADGRCTLGLEDAAGNLPLETKRYEVVSETARELTFVGTFADGLRITKKITAHPGKHHLTVQVLMENTSAEPINAQYRIWAASRVVPDSETSPDIEALVGTRRPDGGVRVLTHTPRSVRKKPIEASNNAEKPILWAGAANRYFASVLMPEPPAGQSTLNFINSSRVEYLPQSDVMKNQWGKVSVADNVIVSLLSQRRPLDPGARVIDEYTCFLGPRKKAVLAEYPALTKLIDYGMFGFISKLLLGILNAFHRVIPNYGVGIILLTILVKVCLFPVTRKGQVNMHKMQRLAPLIKEVQERYKDDRQRQGREMMDMYRRHGANPMSGCWPMFLQLPIFWGLFTMLRKSIDLRHAGFVSWISDLSQPDTLTVISGFPVHILPVLMIISWVGQQLTMPKPADPQQAQTQKMMIFMPIIFGVMFYGMAAGLTLYWLTSTFLGIIEQKIIKWQIRHLEARGAFTVIEVLDAPGKSASRPPKRK